MSSSGAATQERGQYQVTDDRWRRGEAGPDKVVISEQSPENRKFRASELLAWVALAVALPFLLIGLGLLALAAWLDGEAMSHG